MNLGGGQFRKGQQRERKGSTGGAAKGTDKGEDNQCTWARRQDSPKLDKKERRL